MNTVISFRKKFISAFMSVLLAFMMFPFAAFADTGQESSDTTDAVQDQVAPGGEDATNNQTAPEGDSTGDEQDGVDSDVPTDADVTDENPEAVQQDDADTNLQGTDGVADPQAAPQTLKNNDAKQSKSQNAPVKKNTPAKEITESGAVDNMDWTLYADGELVLSPHPGTDGKFVTDYFPWWDFVDEITSVRVEGTVYTSGSLRYMFSDINNVTSIDLTGLDTSAVTDMGVMFTNCYALESLDISGFDTSKVTDMSYMFDDCRSLEALDLSQFDTSQVTNMSFMFNECYELTSLDVSNFDTSQVTNMRSMFGECYELASLDVSNFDTSQVTNMRSMFGKCQKLTSLDTSNFDTSNVTDMSWMFSACAALEDINFTSFKTSNVTNMCAMFSGCSSMKNLDLSSFNTSEVTTMQQMFNNCEKLETLNLEGFNTSKVDDMCSMFNECTKLTDLDLSNFDTSSLTLSAYMFDGCKSLTSLDLSGFDMSGISACDRMFSDTPGLNKITFSNKFKYYPEMDLRAGTWQNGDLSLTPDKLVNLSSAQLAGTWTYTLDMKPAGTHGYTLWDFDGNQLFNTWYTDADGDTYYFGEDGYSVKYLQEINGKSYYFNGRDYTQFTGVLTWKKDGRISFFDAKRNGEMSKDRWISWKGKKYYLDDEGYSVKYRQYIDGDMYYFNSNGTQYTGVLTWKNNGSISFFDAKQKGKASTNRWISWKGKKYYLNDKGYSVRYLQTIKGNEYYFNKAYQMQTGVVIWKATGKLSYFDPRQAGKMSKNRWISYKGTKYYLDENGYSTKKVR